MSGLKRYAVTLERHLANQGVQVKEGYPQVPIPAPLRRLAYRLGWDVTTFLQTYPVWAKVHHADLYHLASENLASLLNVRRLKPSVVTVHAFFTYLLRNDPLYSIYDHAAHEWVDALAAKGLRRADAIIAVSDYVKGTLVKQLSLPPERIHVIPEAVDHDIFHPRAVPQSFRDKYRLTDRNTYILYVGSEQPRKNFLALVRAIARLRAQFPEVRLLKVGQAEFQEEREKALILIDQLGIEQSVYFFDHAGDELPFLYSVSDIFVFPSLYEGFGFPPLEAMACGTPVICSNRTSLPEVVGGAALLLDPTDEDKLVELMARMVQDKDLRSKYRQHGLNRAQHFSWAEVASQTISVYEKVLSDGNAKPVT